MPEKKEYSPEEFRRMDEVFSKLSPQEHRILALMSYGFMPDEVEPHLGYLESNSAESLIAERGIVPQSWILAGFSVENPPLTPEDFMKVLRFAPQDDYLPSEDELKESAQSAADFMSMEGKQIWKRSTK